MARNVMFRNYCFAVDFAVENAHNALFFKYGSSVYRRGQGPLYRKTFMTNSLSVVWSWLRNETVGDPFDAKNVSGPQVGPLPSIEGRAVLVFFFVILKRSIDNPLFLDCDETQMNKILDFCDQGKKERGPHCTVEEGGRETRGTLWNQLYSLMSLMIMSLHGKR